MTKIYLLVLTLLHAVVLPAFSQVKQDAQFLENKVYTLNAATAKINPKTSEVVADDRLSNKQGVTLKAGIEQAIDGERTEPDLTFSVKAPKADRYVMRTYAVTDTYGAALMKKAKGKYESMYMRIQIGDQRGTKRVVYVPWDRPAQLTGKFALNGEEQEIKVWLPRGVRLEYINLKTYVPPRVPPAAVNYKPTVVPPSSHPRLWVNKESLPAVKAGLEKPENKAAWEKVKKDALIPFVFKFDPKEEMSFNAKLEVAAETKAFYYLMTGDKKIGREAIELMVDYLSHVEFGNLLDITREMGRAIYTASEVYDWTYDLLTPKEKQIMVSNLMRLADDMEIGWPPFLTGITNGHGNEAQVNRDLLALSIAIYNENPLPYQYTSYAILETLVPMRKFEYQSPRHNQGVNYGAYRFAWEMHAALLMQRMSGKAVFDDNIKDMSKFWLYMRTPDGQMLRDGDGFSAGTPTKPYYWKYPKTMFLMSAYSKDPITKGEFIKQGGLASEPVLFLLLNDPNVKADQNLNHLPLTMDFGPILGSMIARTGWNVGPESDDVVVEIKGGGYHFGNHQHADAGSIQIYYRGFQLGDIGLYKFYGTPYDMGFNKRSIAHSMMLAVDPNEKFYRSQANDGGARFNQRAPKTPKEVQTDPWFNNGKVVSADFGPSKQKPFFSYFSADLAAAYTKKLSDYTRGFLFLNLDRKDIPAAIILTDDMITSNPEFKKYWQINTINLPEETKDGVILKNHRGENVVGKTHVQMLIPAPADRTMKVFSGKNANSAFAAKFEAPPSSHREGRANRIMISPNQANKRDRFLTVFQIVDGDTKPLPVTHQETEVSYVVYLADRVVSMSNSTNLIDKSFTIDIPTKGKYQVVLAGMKAGDWNVKSQKGKFKFNTNVAEGKNTIFFEAEKGKYIITPGQLAGAKTLVVNASLMPKGQ